MMKKIQSDFDLVSYTTVVIKSVAAEKNALSVHKTASRRVVWLQCSDRFQLLENARGHNGLSAVVIYGKNGSRSCRREEDPNQRG